MKWKKYPEEKPTDYSTCLVYGQMYDTKIGLPLTAVFDSAVYFEENDCFTIGNSSGQPWIPQYWMEFPCKFPELHWPSQEEIKDFRSKLKGK